MAFCGASYPVAGCQPLDADRVARSVARFLRLPAPLTPDDDDALPCLRDGWRECNQASREFRREADLARGDQAVAAFEGDEAAFREAQERERNLIGWADDAEGKAWMIEEEAHRLKTQARAQASERRPPSAPAPVVPVRSAARQRERRARRTARRSSSSGDDGSGSSDSDPEPEPLAVRAAA
jgi:hypothetical protein